METLIKFQYSQLQWLSSENYSKKSGRDVILRHIKASSVKLQLVCLRYVPGIQNSQKYFMMSASRFHVIKNDCSSNLGCHAISPSTASKSDFEAFWKTASFPFVEMGG